LGQQPRGKLLKTIDLSEVVLLSDILQKSHLFTDTTLYDTTLSEVIDVTDHVSGNCIGNSQNNIDNITRFTENEQMELNAKKCNEMVVDFRKIKTVIPPVCIGQQPMSRVKRKRNSNKSEQIL
jgi:hypothetical protein